MELKEIRKKRLVNCYCLGAKSYKKLMNRKFIITTETDEVFNVRFNKRDFQHLCGIESDLNPNEFFYNAFDDKLSLDNIKSRQRKNWNTLKDKAEKIKNIDETIINVGLNDILLLDVLRTPTRNYPLAIRNDTEDVSIAFISDDCHARSLRKARHSLDVKRELKIKKIECINL